LAPSSDWKNEPQDRMLHYLRKGDIEIGQQQPYGIRCWLCGAAGV